MFQMKTKLKTKLSLVKDTKKFYVFKILDNPLITKTIQEFWISKEGQDHLSPEYIISVFQIAYQKFKI